MNEAERIANEIEIAFGVGGEAAVELRRLSAINAELVEALEMFERAASHTGHAHEILSVDSVVRQVMRLALEKAKQ